MSFILDALRKSENERRQQQANAFATVPSGPASPPAPRWLWILGVLLAINIIVVAVLLLRPDAPPAAPLPAAEPVEDVAAPPVEDRPEIRPEPTADETAFANRLAAARREQPPPPSDDAPPDEAPEAASAVPPVRGDASPGAPVGMATLPSLEELVLQGAVNLPALHIDLHVYNEVPSRRFVSINMNKYRENERLAEGPVVREITPEGVVLEYEGKAFALLQ